jgi:transcriptional regulator with XRE-family HTH domain
MHLVAHGAKLTHPPFYRKRSTLARPDSLPHLFLKLRQNRNLTKKALAAKFGISEDYISAIEGGSKFPSIGFCLKCAGEFDINPMYVKNKWAKEAIERFGRRLMRRLGLFD